MSESVQGSSLVTRSNIYSFSQKAKDIKHAMPREDAEILSFKRKQAPPKPLKKPLKEASISLLAVTAPTTSSDGSEGQGVGDVRSSQQAPIAYFKRFHEIVTDAGEDGSVRTKKTKMLNDITPYDVQVESAFVGTGKGKARVNKGKGHGSKL